MPFDGFHSEWITIKDHRIYLKCRASFPTDEMKFLARVAVETCEHLTAHPLVQNPSNKARVVKLYYNDKACDLSITIASTDEADKCIEGRLQRIFNEMAVGRIINVEVNIVPPGDTTSDHYNHMEYLSTASEIAADKFKCRETEYQ